MSLLLRELRCHDMLSKFHEYWFRFSGIVKVTTAIFVMLNKGFMKYAVEQVHMAQYPRTYETAQRLGQAFERFSRRIHTGTQTHTHTAK
jgi:hypothetical protein